MLLIIIGFIVIILGVGSAIIVKRKHKNDEEKRLSLISIIIGIIGGTLTFLGFFQNLADKGTTSDTNDNAIITNHNAQTGLDSIQLPHASNDLTKQPQPTNTETTERNASTQNNQEGRVVVESIYPAGDVIVVNLKIKEYFNGEVDVTILKNDICTLDNSYKFPLKLWADQPTFSVKLKCKPYKSLADKKSIFVVDASNKYSGDYSKAIEIDISKYVDNQ